MVNGDPKSLKELNDRTNQNTRIEGFGAETTIIMPCPFCGEVDWLRFPVTAGLNNYEEVQKPQRCSSCHRVAKIVITRHAGGVSQELVFVSGPDLPDFMPGLRKADDGK